MDTGADPIKRRSGQKSSVPSKRKSTGSPPPKNPIPSIQSILHLPEDLVWSLRKQDLRNYFLALQQFALNPYPLDASSSGNHGHATARSSTHSHLPPLLRLPLEIREIIYTHLLSPPSDPPIRGPHPRQLQTNISLTQSFPPSILLLNHQIHREALPLMYGAPNQTVFVTVDYNIWTHKARRSDLVLSSSLASSIKHLHLSIHLGSEKRNNKLGEVEADVRMSEVKKAIKKVRKWLAGADLQSLKISWREPSQTYTWEQKKEVLDGLKAMNALRVDAGEINWGLDWNKGRKYRFEVEYFKELERARQEDDCTALDQQILDS